MASASRRFRRIAVPILLYAAAVTIAAVTWVRVRDAGRAEAPVNAARVVREDDSLAFKTSIPYSEVHAVLSRLQPAIPAELSRESPAELHAAWLPWVLQHEREVRARLDRGDLDSVINFWLYGTRFTTLPRVTATEIRKPDGAARGEELMLRRLDDLVTALTAPRADERLRFVRDVIGRHGIDPSSSEGREKTSLLLAQAGMKWSPRTGGIARC